jgi:hydrogenase maturation protein HypF
VNQSFCVPATDVERMKVVVQGVVQGVGFRPFVYRLATELGLSGWVANSPQGVFIEVEGKKELLQKFLLRMGSEKPPHSSLQSIESSFVDPANFRTFEIHESNHDGERTALVLPDIATCPECIKEIFDPFNRRHLYPFTNCTQCGPRFSIIMSLPYDRPSTTMRKFEMCDKCKAEYENPVDRRFHAQPNACPECGPHVELWDASGKVLERYDVAIRQAAKDVLDGKILALKGLGGFHLVVDARNEAAVARLRSRKRREAKPLAVMFPSFEMVRRECEVSELEQRVLTSSEAPITLLKKRGHFNPSIANVSSSIASSVAPDNPYLGAMLPYSPLHHILLRELGIPVVATSGNVSDEPICTDEHEALSRLKEIADVYLVHNRPIIRHVDDSVVRVMLGREQVLRRARGFAPLPIPLKDKMQTMLAVGAHQKNSVALTKGSNVFVSQHIGDLETKESYEAFQKTVGSLESLFDTKPDVVVADLHPDYLSTQFAERMSVPLRQIQHHYAHVASCMAENELDGSVLGVSWDGTGFGTDGTIWGGEFLLTNDSSFRRVATLRPFCLPGGNKAVKEPRRTALGLLYEILGDAVFEMHALAPVESFSESELSVLRRVVPKRLNAPMTSSVGRLFDAVASMTGLAQRVGFEGQAAMQLEFLIDDSADVGSYDFLIEASTGCEHDSDWVIDWAPMIVALLHDVFFSTPTPVIAQRFHNTLADILVDIAHRVGEQRVVLTGGCFQNKYLTERAVQLLQREGFKPYWHQRVPPNDGGIVLGQVFAASRASGSKTSRLREVEQPNYHHSKISAL